jgi:hypothetical protein
MLPLWRCLMCPTAVRWGTQKPPWEKCLKYVKLEVRKRDSAGMLRSVHLCMVFFFGSTCVGHSGGSLYIHSDGVQLMYILRTPLVLSGLPECRVSVRFQLKNNIKDFQNQRFYCHYTYDMYNILICISIICIYTVYREREIIQKCKRLYFQTTQVKVKIMDYIWKSSTLYF